MRITEMNENYEEFVSRDCTNTETWAANWVVAELLKQSNKVVNVSCDPVLLANECYWAGNNLEVGLIVADDNDSLYYLDSITFKEDDKELGRQVAPLAARISILCNELKLRHVARLQAGQCDLEQGSTFNDLLSSFEHISSHCCSVMIAMLKEEDDDTHVHSTTVYDFSKEDYIDIIEACKEEYKFDSFGTEDVEEEEE